MTLMPDGNVRYTGNWKFSPDRDTPENVTELKKALSKMRNIRPRTPGCAACHPGADPQADRRWNGEHNLTCRKTVIKMGMANSYWEVKIDTRGRAVRQREADGADAADPENKRAKQSGPTREDATMEPEVARLSTQLYYILVMTTSGSALDKCHNAGANEGFEAWRQFVLEWEPKLRSRFVGLRMQAMAYKFTGDIPSGLAAFERLVRDYESQSNKKIDDDEKIGVVLLGMEDSRVKEHLIRNSAGLDTWPKMREEILEITRTQQYVDSQPTPMQLGAIPRGGKDPKGGRPKGGKDPKGAGKKGKDKGGKADGGKNPNGEKECFYCRKKGHVKAECRKRQRDLAAAENRRGPLAATPGGQSASASVGPAGPGLPPPVQPPPGQPLSALLQSQHTSTFVL